VGADGEGGVVGGAVGDAVDFPAVDGALGDAEDFESFGSGAVAGGSEGGC